jgi:hypothetical protein
MRKITVFATAVMMTIASPAMAKNQGKLPKDATPMPSEEIRALLSGNSIDFKVAQYYFAPDGTLWGLSKDWYADGTWTVEGNTWCLNSSWHGPKKAKEDNYTQCNEKYKVGKKIFTKNTKGEEKYLGDVSTDQEKKIRKGDIVSAKAMALKAKYGN